MEKKKKATGEKEKTTYQRVISGEIEPQGSQKGWKNLEKRKPFNQWDREKMHEVAVMGGKAVQQLHGEKKTARDALKNVLTLKITDDIVDMADIDPSIADRLRRDNPDATLYDLIHAVAVGRALGGNVKAMEYVRDTHGDKPIERVEVTENVTTEADRELMRKIAERLESPDVVIAADITGNDVKTGTEGGGKLRNDM